MAKRIQMRKNRFLALQKMAEQKKNEAMNANNAAMNDGGPPDHHGMPKQTVSRQFQVTKLICYVFFCLALELSTLGWASQRASPSTIHLIFSFDSVWKSNFWIPSLILTFLSNSIGYFKPLLQKNISKCFSTQLKSWTEKHKTQILNKM